MTTPTPPIDPKMYVRTNLTGEEVEEIIVKHYLNVRNQIIKTPVEISFGSGSGFKLSQARVEIQVEVEPVKAKIITDKSDNKLNI